MELKDLKLVSELIQKYGIKQFEEVAKTHSLFLDYMKNSEADDYPFFKKNNNLNVYPKFYENEKLQIFTNCKNSIYYFEPKIVNFDLLKTNSNNPIALPASKDKILKYLDNAKKMLGDNPSLAKHLLKTNKYGIIVDFNSHLNESHSIFLQDYEMIRLLLKNLKIYISKEEPIIHFQGENGYAYVLSRNSRYKSMF